MVKGECVCVLGGRGGSAERTPRKCYADFDFLCFRGDCRSIVQGCLFVLFVLFVLCVRAFVSFL